MDAPPATTEVHILRHRDIWWTVEWDDHGKVRRAAALAPDDEVPPPPRRGSRLRLAACVPHTPEAAWEALPYALDWAQGPPGGPLPPDGTPAWTRHATRYRAHMRRHGAGTGHRLLTWPTELPDALQEAEEVLGFMTKQVFQLNNTVRTSRPDVPATCEHPVFAPGHAPEQQAQGAPPQQGQPNARFRPRCEEAQGPGTGQTPTQAKSQVEELDRRESSRPCIPSTPSVPGCNCPPSTPRPRAPPSGYGPQVRSSTNTASPATTRGSRSTSSGTQPLPTTRRWGAPSNSGETETVVRWSPCSYAAPTRSTSPAPSTRAKSPMHGPTPTPEAEPQGTRSSGRHQPLRRLTGPGPDTARPHDYRSPATGAYRSPPPHQHPKRARGHLRPC